MSIDALFLDLDETLCDTRLADEQGKQDMLDYLRSSHKELDGEKLITSYLDMLYGNFSSEERRQSYKSIDDELTRRALLWKYASEDLGTPLPDEITRDFESLILKLRMQHFTFFPGVPEMLARLIKRFRLVVLTDGPHYSQKPKVSASHVADHVDRVFLSIDLGGSKRDPAIFHKACTELKLEPAKVVHVGDKLKTDIIGANMAGIRSVWMKPPYAETPNFNHPDFSEMKPHHTIDDILHLESLIVEII